MDRKFVLSALVYAIVGLLLGIHMAASQNHGQLVTHAHIMLVGFVVTFIYALCHKLWLGEVSGWLPTAQFYLHQVGVVGMSSGLFLLYGKHIAIETIDPVLAASSMAVLGGMVLMTVLFVKSGKRTA